MIIILLTLFCLIVLAVASLLTAWFSSTLPSHIFAFLHKIGVCKHKQEAWDNFDEFGTIDWQSWLAIYWSQTWRELFIGTLITCPICLSFHLSFWCSVAASLVTYYAWIAAPEVFLIIPVATACAPILSLILHNLFTKLEK